MAENGPKSLDEGKLRVENGSPEALRSDSRTPDIACNAAEVADSAMILDREEPTPPMSDEEAGRIGYRRMSHTPIPEVSETAAEVADSALMLDKLDMVCSMRTLWITIKRRRCAASGYPLGHLPNKGVERGRLRLQISRTEPMIDLH